MNIKVIIRKIKTVIRKPKTVVIKFLYLISPLLNDKVYLKMLFPLYTGYKLDLKNPRTYNQKLQWLKLYYRKPIMTKMVDKYEAKEVVREMIGDEFIIKNYGVWRSFDEINFEKLPSQFVLKTTHDSGGVVIVKDKNKFDKNAARKKLSKHLKLDQFSLSREWPYKGVQPRILAEEYMEEERGELRDYKFFCFDGIVKAMFIASERQSGEEVKFDFYDANFNPLAFVQGHPNSSKAHSRPESFDKMIDLSERLSKGFPHVRIDLYNINGKIYFGEFTFFHFGGLVPFHPKQWDYTLGDWIDLSKSKLK